jgi:type IV secretion system protein VirD4
VVKQVPGDRVGLGRSGRRLLAAERRQSVLVVGPSQSGKTTGLAVPAICAWDGPVLATSVKADLLEMTIAERRGRGGVAVYDPTGATRASPSEVAGWSPLLSARTWPGARRVASAMCSVASADLSMEDAGFWYAAAEKLLAPLLFAAATAGASMSDVVRWIDDEEAGEPLLALELAAVPDATRAARTSFLREDRQRSSVFSTAETVVAGFADPAVAASADGAVLDPRSLVDGGSRSPRTLYCCAPAREQERLRPVFTALVREVIDAAFAESARRGQGLAPGFLVVLDEAANVAPVAELDSIVSTAAGHGITLVTVWHDMAQIEARYGRRWSTIVNNHRAKVVCGGISDSLTLEHLEQLIGDHEAVEVSRTVGGDGSASRTETPTRRRTAPGGSLRRLPPGEAVLVYGALPPARVSLETDVRIAGRAPSAGGRPPR